MQEPANIGSTHAAFVQRRARIQERIIGQTLMVDCLLIALLADGYLLVEGYRPQISFYN